jgi:hypothetical protein
VHCWCCRGSSLRSHSPAWRPRACIARTARRTRAGKALILPTVSDWQYLGNNGSPPSQSACNAVGRRCFNPVSLANSYDYATLHSLGNEGQGKTIAIVDSFGSSTIRRDLGVFNAAFGLPHMCGESGPSNPTADCPSSASPRS